MRPLIALVFAALIGTPVLATDSSAPTQEALFRPADMPDLSEFRWKKRPVVVFADNVNDPAYLEQIDLLEAERAELEERDVVVLTDTDPEARSALRLKMRPRGFMLVIVGKDGGIKLRKPFPWNVREISRSIDKMPMRQREIREAKEAARER